MGYLPADRKIVANAERSRDAVDAAVPALLEGFARGDIDAGGVSRDRRRAAGRSSSPA